ncbi:MAG: hypothetical protein PHS54_03315 [Clostridia bacterium]|nr:hypothetical protein [Clostridia bacterium]
MKKIIRILSLIIFISAVISTAIWLFLNKNVEKPLVKETSEENQSMVTEDITKEKPESEEIFGYDSETSNDHIVFDIGKFNFEFTRVKDSMDTNLVVKNGTKTVISKKYTNAVSSISKILFKEKNIILINYYSGGAHCCSLVIPYLIDGEKIIEGKGLDLGNIDIFNGESFFIKDGKLFTESVDDRFAYFEMDYADSGSMFFTTYYELLIDPLEFVNRNELFIDSYSKLYVNSQNDSKEKINKENCVKDEIEKYQVFASLVSRYTYGFLSGVNREKLKAELSNDWWCFPEKNLDKIESDIYKALIEKQEGENFAGENIKKNWGKIIGQ